MNKRLLSSRAETMVLRSLSNVQLLGKNHDKAVSEAEKETTMNF